MWMALFSFLPWLFAPDPSPPAGPTLFPAPVRAQEQLRFVVPGVARTEARDDADTVAVFNTGDVVEVWENRQEPGAWWIRIREDGWVRAAWLDRIAADFPGAPEPGREGLIDGRVLPWDWRPSDLTQLPDSVKAPGFEGKVLRLRQDAATALTRMLAAAAADSVEIGVFSAFRPASYQRRLYRKAVDRDPNQSRSAAPGRSEHQLGTTVDVSTPSANPLDPVLEHRAAGRWIEARAAEFGFVVTFSRERHAARGVAFEPWHLRFVGERVHDDSDW